MTPAGPFTIARGAQTGFIESVTDGTAMLTPTYNGYGETSEPVMDVGLTSSLRLHDGASLTRRTAFVQFNVALLT